jgi:hypothetical protein
MYLCDFPKEWREGCWRFAVFPGMLTGRRVEVVFAVYLNPRLPPPKIVWFSRRL